jgi:hypothetical protein
MLPDAILATWRVWLVWCQINQTRSVLLMLPPCGRGMFDHCGEERHSHGFSKMTIWEMSGSHYQYPRKSSYRR